MVIAIDGFAPVGMDRVKVQTVEVIIIARMYIVNIQREKLFLMKTKRKNLFLLKIQKKNLYLLKNLSQAKMTSTKTVYLLA